MNKLFSAISQKKISFFILIVCAIIYRQSLLSTLNRIVYAVSSFQFEAETARLSTDGVVIKTDSTASNGAYVEFTTSTNSTSPTPTSSPTSNFQPQAPYYASFYYPWYKTASTDGSWSYWTDHGNNPPNTWFSHYLPDPKPGVFDPSTELYSANNYSNFKWQVSKMAEAKQEVAISSWWGINTKEDVALKNILSTFMPASDNPYPNLRWTTYYEKEGFGDPSVTEITNDLNHIKNNYINSKYYLKVNNKPVIFVYGGAEDVPGTVTSRWKQANNNVGNTFYVVLKVFPGFTTDPNQPDSWHQYAPAVRSGTHSPYSSFVSPGFWLDDAPTTSARLGRNLSEFSNAVTTMVSSNATWKLVETWNEWGEGTSVEPGIQVKLNTSTNKEEIDPSGTPFGNAYIDILNQKLPPLEAGTGSTTQSSNPTPTNIVSQPTPTSMTTTGTSVTIAAVGDMVEGADNSCGSTSCKTKQVSDLIQTINPAVFLALGDVQYEYGELSDFNTYYEPTYGRFKSITYPVIGNHEYLDPSASTHYPGDQVSYWTYFGRNGNTSQKPGNPSQGYYAFNLGAWRLYAINSNCSKAGGCSLSSPQTQWLKNDLANNPKTCQLMYMHHPYISSDSRGFDTSEMQDIWQAFYNAGGDVILAGHSHFYERYQPINPSKIVNEAKGIRQFIVGTGGKNVYDPADPIAKCTNKGVKVECTSATWGKAFGMLKMTLSSNSYQWQYVQIPNDVNPTFADSGTANCHLS